MSQITPEAITGFLDFIGMSNRDPKQFMREVLANQQRITVSLENLGPPQPFGDNDSIGPAAGTVLLDYTFPVDGLLKVVRTMNVILNGFTAATVDNILIQEVSLATGEVTTLLADDSPSVTVIATIEHYSNAPSGGGSNATMVIQNEFPRIFYPGDRLLIRIEVSVGTCTIGLILSGEKFLPGCRPNFT